MKSTFSKNQTYTNTYTLPIIICIFIIIIVLLLVFIKKYYEQFKDTIGQYDYMVPSKNAISSEMLKILHNKMDKK